MPTSQLPPWLEKALAPIVLSWRRSSCRSSSTPARRSSRTACQALAYVVMALGLNIVVGFAGLLDLGYVAFFAIGAYTMGWFGSGFLSKVGHGKGIHILVSGLAAQLPGVHVNFLHRSSSSPMIFAAIAGVIIGLPTLRLRGDYIAIVTLAFGEIIGRIAINGDEHRHPRPAVHGRPPGHHARSTRSTCRSSAVRAAGAQALVLLRARPGGDRAVRELPAARLAAGPGVGRAARGRGRRGGHGRAVGQDQAAGLRHRRRVRRHRRARSSARS